MSTKDTSNLPVLHTATATETELLEAGADLTPLSTEDLLPHLAALNREAEALSLKDKADRTLETYQWAWQRFAAWCLRRRMCPLPAAPSTLTLFLVDVAQHGIEPLKAPTVGNVVRKTKPVAYSTLKIYLSAIAREHSLADLPMPELSKKETRTLDGIVRAKAAKPNQKAAFSEEQLQKLLTSLPETPIGLRNRAMILCAYTSGGRRRSELVGMRREHLKLVSRGYIWDIPRSKTSLSGFSSEIPHVFRALPSSTEALDAWLDRAEIRQGFVFRPVDRHGNMSKDDEGVSGRVFAELLKDGAASLGLHEETFSGHSIRASFITNSLRNGDRIDAIMRKTGHKSVAVFIRYARELGVDV